MNWTTQTHGLAYSKISLHCLIKHPVIIITRNTSCSSRSPLFSIFRTLFQHEVSNTEEHLKNAKATLKEAAPLKSVEERSRTLESAEDRSRVFNLESVEMLDLPNVDLQDSINLRIRFF